MPKFQAGDIVMYVRSGLLRQTFPAGAYRVVSLMPREDNQSEAAYRVRSVLENVERIAQEGELIHYK